MKTYGSAVLTAIQAQHMSIDEIEKLIQEREYKVHLKGGSPTEWLDCFWKNIAIMEAQRCQKKVCKKNSRKIFSINVVTCKSVIVIVQQ